MANKIIKCEYCGKVLFCLSDDEKLFVKTRKLGYIYKMPFLFSGQVQEAVFCTKDCCKSWFEESFTEDERKRANQAVQSFKNKIPEYSKNIAETIGDFQRKLQYIKQELSKDRKLQDILNDNGMETMKKGLQNILKRVKENEKRD